MYFVTTLCNQNVNS